MGKRVGIVGAGVSGLLACKYVLQKGFEPVVFEADGGIGGVWAHAMETTRLQSPRLTYEFSDFPWPPEVVDDHPSHSDLMAYLQSYASHFDLLRHFLFHSRVLAVDFLGPPEEEEEGSWELWSGTGEAFGGGKWNVTVEHKQPPSPTVEVYEVDFLILCVGRFCGFPNWPSFPPGKGPEAFRGQVIHSMDYCNMPKDDARRLLEGKRVAVIGSMKSALDLSAECSIANGATNPCTLIFRTTKWILPSFSAWGISLAFLYFNRFSDLPLHKPYQGFLHRLLATFTSPLMWLTSKFVESYILWKTPVRKYDMVPKQSFFEGLSSCKIALIPHRFFERIQEGSIVPRKSQSLAFCESGIILDNGDELELDLVIFATGFRGDEKIRDLFSSPKYRDIAIGSPNTTVPLYREMIHPRIPQLAIIGYSESHSNLHVSEMKSKWVASFLAKGVRLPSIGEMEADVREWEKFVKRYGKAEFRRSCIWAGNNFYSDRLCEDMRQNPYRKKGFLSNLFVPYLPSDYRDLVP